MNVASIRMAYNAVGAKNIGEFKGLIRAFASDAASYSGRFEFGAKELENIVRLGGNNEIAARQNKLLELMQQYFPKAGNKDSKHIIDLILNRQGTRGSAEVIGRTITKKGEEVANANLHIASDASGIRLNMAGTTEASKTNVNLTVDQEGLLGLVKLGQSGAVRKALANANVVERNGVTTINLPKTTTNGVTTEFSMTAPTGYTNGYTQILSDGKFNNPGEVLKLIG